MSCIMGIDPGAQGAFCALEATPIRDARIKFWPLKDLDFWHFQQIIQDYEVHHIYLEKAQSMPKQGIASTFNYGVGFGKLVGWIEATEVPFTMVTPREWTKDIHKGIMAADPKAKSIIAIQRLFPSLDMKAMASTKLVRSGMIDALLIAEYGRRIFR